MTTLKCRTCGAHWTEGPTRDMRYDEDCRKCMASNFDNAIAEAVEALGAAVKYFESPEDGCFSDNDLEKANRALARLNGGRE